MAICFPDNCAVLMLRHDARTHNVARSLPRTAPGAMTEVICVVEDNPDNRMLLRAILDDRYEIVEYEDGVSALAGLLHSRPDLVLLDISLPGMDGMEVLSRVRAEPALRALPVIALTAHAMTGDRARFLDAGFDEYISKPITDEQLLFAAIDRCMRRP